MQPYILTQKINHFEYILLILFSVLGLFLLCSANDLLTAYLAIELQSLAFYVLASFKRNSSFSVDAGIKYFILGAFSSSLFLFGSSLLYGITGTINFSDFKSLFCHLDPTFFTNVGASTSVLEEVSLRNICDEVASEDLSFTMQLLEITNRTAELKSDLSYLYSYLPFDVNLIKFSLMFILISLFFKLAIAPFHLWAPDVYEGAPSSSTFFFSVVPKLAIFVLLIRLFNSSFFSVMDSLRYITVIVVVLSIIVGSFGGLMQRKLKTLLVYSSISHMGYSLIAFNSGTFEGIQMLFSYLVVYSFSGLCIWSIFMVTQLKTNYFQKANKDLTDLVLLSKSNPILAIFFSTVLLSVAGFPPMIGFLVKMSVFLVAIESFMYFVALISILCSVIATFYYLRLIKIFYFEKVLVGKLYYPISFESSVLITVLFFLFLFLFINPTLLFLLSYKFSLLLSI